MWLFGCSSNAKNIPEIKLIICYVSLSIRVERCSSSENEDIDEELDDLVYERSDKYVIF